MRGIPFFKCSIAARKMWRCQLQTKVSCGSLWTQDATWYLCRSISQPHGLGFQFFLLTLQAHNVRVQGFEFEPDRSVGSGLNRALYSAGELQEVGSFRRCSSRLEEESYYSLYILHSGWIPDETTHGHIGLALVV